jgi:S1-C subfamily serine protease
MSDPSEPNVPPATPPEGAPEPPPLAPAPSPDPSPEPEPGPAPDPEPATPSQPEPIEIPPTPPPNATPPDEPLPPAEPEPPETEPAPDEPEPPPDEVPPEAPIEIPATPVEMAPAPAPAARIDSSEPVPDTSEDDEEYDEFDEDTAARRIGRRFVRATTDILELGEELRGHYRRHDGIVIALALAIVFAAAQIHRRLVTPEPTPFDEHGLTFKRSTAWLAPESVPLPAPRLVPGVAPARPVTGALPYHVVFTSALDAEVRMEVLIDDRPLWSNLLTGLELDRRTRYGELYAADSSEVRSVEGHDWLRTEYHYAFVGEIGDQPRIGHAVEYATVDREHLYVVTFQGTPAATERMEDVTAPSLRVESKTGMPLLPHVGRLDRTHRPPAVDAAFPSTVMVVVVDVASGRLRAAGGGSGTVIGTDGSILTNYHVLRAEAPSTPDRPGTPPHLHDLFVIGRFVGVDKPPQLLCAGRPSRAKIDIITDLALLKCDTDLDGRAWLASSIAWPALATKHPPAVRPLERLWVLGYPDVGGGGLTLAEGTVEGFTGEGALSHDYLKTDAPISHGNSGGPVVDDEGHLIGIATAFRTRITIDGNVVETAKVGLVRPIAAAENAIETVRVGWTPREGHASFDLEPTAVEAPPEGTYLSARIFDGANDSPVAGALLMVLRPSYGVGDIDMNRLDEQVLAWGRAGADGEVQLKQPVPFPGSYSILAVARGYEPLVGDHVLHLTDDAGPYFDWGIVRMQAR